MRCPVDWWIWLIIVVVVVAVLFSAFVAIRARSRRGGVIIADRVNKRRRT